MKNLFLLIFIVLITSCADLNHINTFSTVTVQTLNSYAQINYSFTYSYYHFTETSKLYSFDSTQLNKNRLALPVIMIDSNQVKLAKKADDVITLYITSISNYFQAISKLSDKNLIGYSFEDVSKNLKNDAVLRRYLNIKNDKQVDAVANIATLVTNGIMSSYRSGKVQNIIIKYDDNVETCLQTLIDIFSQSLLPAIDDDKGLVDTKYAKLLANPAINLGNKIAFIDDHINNINDLNKSRDKIGCLIAALKKIKSEQFNTVQALKHHKIDSKEIQTMVTTYAAEVYQLYTAIKSLK